MLIVKIMSDQDLPDDDARKTYRLVTGVTSVVFAHTDRGGDLTINYVDGEEELTLAGNVYVMNESGKTISSFTPPDRPRPPAKLPDGIVKHMVDRFLGWYLPENFQPDAGISFKADFNEHTAHPMKHRPTGTNLFDATQADSMVRYMLDGFPPKPKKDRTFRIGDKVFPIPADNDDYVLIGEELYKMAGGREEFFKYGKFIANPHPGGNGLDLQDTLGYRIYDGLIFPIVSTRGSHSPRAG